MRHEPRSVAALTRGLVGPVVGPVVGLVVVLAVLLGATACGGTAAPPKQAAPLPTPSVSTPPPVPDVEATGLPVGVALTVTGTSVGTENGANLDFVSPVYSVEPAGRLDRAATLTVKLDNAVPTSTALVVASREAPGKPWTFQRGMLTPDQQHVRYATKSLHQLAVLSVDVDSALAAFQGDLPKGLTSGVDKDVAKPECAAKDTARELGYSVVATKNPTLHWCFGMQGDARVLTVTNRLLGPIQVAHPQVPVVTAAQVPPAYAPWIGVLGTTSDFLAPGRSATYNADLEPLAGLSISAGSNATIQSLRLLQSTVRALTLRLTSFGAGAANAGAAYKAFLAMPQCAKSLGRGSDALLAGCLSQAKLVRVFGARGVLLEPLLTAPSTPVLMRTLAQRLATTQPTTPQRIDVKRAAPDFTSLVGYWSGHTRLLAITGDGVAIETLSNGCCETVVKLTYQLTDPVTKGDASSAQAKITKVTLGNRKLIKGRVPKVGDTGVIRVNQGIIRSPYLKTSYCSPAKAKKGACGA
jgi:hypothetical protein